MGEHTNPATRICSVCKKPAEKQCGKCKDTFYCSKEHQVEAWPTHKKTCKPPGAGSGVNTAGTPRDTAGGNKASSMIAQMLGQSLDAPVDFFAGLSKHDAYVRLIDAYRLRVEDDYAVAGDTHGIYNQDPPLPDFENFLRLAIKNHAVPSWWKLHRDVERTLKVATTDSWANIEFAVEKSDIVEHYSDPTAPMLLRFLAEKVYGRPIY